MCYTGNPLTTLGIWIGVEACKQRIALAQSLALCGSSLGILLLTIILNELVYQLIAFCLCCFFSGSCFLNIGILRILIGILLSQTAV